MVRVESSRRSANCRFCPWKDRRFCVFRLDYRYVHVILTLVSLPGYSSSKRSMLVFVDTGTRHYISLVSLPGYTSSKWSMLVFVDTGTRHYSLFAENGVIVRNLNYRSWQWVYCISGCKSFPGGFLYIDWINNKRENIWN